MHRYPFFIVATRYIQRSVSTSLISIRVFSSCLPFTEFNPRINFFRSKIDTSARGNAYTKILQNIKFQKIPKKNDRSQNRLLSSEMSKSVLFDGFTMLSFREL